MADLEARFRALNEAPAPDLWSEIELAASQRDESRRLLTTGGMLAPLLVLAAVLVLIVVVPLIRQLAGTFEGASPAPVATTAPTLQPAASEPERWDPTYFGADHDTWDVIADLVPEEGSRLAPRHHQLRAEWVEGKLCVDWQVRLVRSDELSSGAGQCATWDELTTDRGTTGHVVEIIRSWTTPPAHVEYHLAWAILNPAIARLEVGLASGETLVPELHPMDPGPRGEMVRLAWVQTLSPVVDLAFYDAAGDRFDPPPLRAP